MLCKLENKKVEDMILVVVQVVVIIEDMVMVVAYDLELIEKYLFLKKRRDDRSRGTGGGYYQNSPTSQSGSGRRGGPRFLFIEIFY